MNLVLWVVQWMLAVVFVGFALMRFADAMSVSRYESIAAREPIFTRDTDFVFGVVFLVAAFGLVSPAIPLAALHQRWVVPAAALVLLNAVIRLYVRYGYGDELSWILGALLLAVAILRGWPYALHS